MKISKELKNIKNNLMINFNLKEINEPTQEQYIKDKWNEIMTWFKTMSEKGSSDRCYQEIYMQIEDLLINDIPQEVIKSIESILSEYSIKIKNTLSGLLNKKGDEFIDELKNLREIDLRWNEIDLNDNENEKIISTVKTKIKIIKFL